MNRRSARTSLTITALVAGGLAAVAALLALILAATSDEHGALAIAASLCALALSVAVAATAAALVFVPSEAPAPTRTKEPLSAKRPELPPVALGGEPVPEDVWRWRGSEVPSFRYKLHESQRRQKLLPMLGHRQRVWRYNSKRTGYQFARDHGVDVPELLVAKTDVDRLDWSALPARFALKPHHGTANRGIFLLVRDPGETSFTDLMDGRKKTADEVADTYRSLAADRKVSAALMVEELLAPRPELAGSAVIPDDLKVYCFYDEPVLVMQRRTHGTSDHRRWRFKFWDSDWNDLGAVKFKDRLDPGLEAPVGRDEVMAAAGRMAATLAIPFIRLDLYDTERGPVFGEVSPHPGPPEIWTPEMDEFLGRKWEVAEARLLAERILPSEPKP